MTCDQRVMLVITFIVTAIFCFAAGWAYGYFIRDND